MDADKEKTIDRSSKKFISAADMLANKSDAMSDPESRADRRHHEYPQSWHESLADIWPKRPHLNHPDSRRLLCGLPSALDAGCTTLD